MSKRYVEFRCSSEPNIEVQTVTFEGREHLVVPVIALLGNSVIQASNASTPEYIPSAVIADSVLSWNGRPTLPQHPKSDGKAISANAPRVFDSLRTGFIFNTEFSADNKLKMLAYLDIARSIEIGGDAKATIEKIQSGQSIDVSVGAIVETEASAGVSLSGEEYGAIWVELSGDHLAFLPSSKGACNQSMGCGAPRIAEEKENNMPEENPPVAVDRAAEPKRDFFSRLLSKFRPAMIFDDGNSDDELRESLADAIKAKEPAFDWICAVYPDSGVVIYMTYVVKGYGSYSGVYQYWRRTFSADESGKKVTLNNDAIEVSPKRVWETVDSEVEMSPRESGSVIGAESTEDNKQLRAAECACKKGDETMANAEERKEAVNELIKSGRFAEEDRKVLEGMSETGWKALAGLDEKKEVETVVAAAATSIDPDGVKAATETSNPPLTEAAVLAAFPDLNAIVTQHRVNEAARKTDLITKLTALGKIPEDKLKVKSLEALEELANIAGLDAQHPVDFSLRSAAEINSKPAYRPLPDPWNLNKKAQATG